MRCEVETNETEFQIHVIFARGILSGFRESTPQETEYQNLENQKIPRQRIFPEDMTVSYITERLQLIHYLFLISGI